MTPFQTKPLEVNAVQFDGSHWLGKEIIKAFPSVNIDLVYDYSTNRYKLKVLFGDRIQTVMTSDYLVKGALGELFVYRENLFEAMFESFFREP